MPATSSRAPAVPVGTVVSLHRYPVKSPVGEDLEEADLDPRGVAGDRLWAVRDPDGKLGSGKSTRRFRRMPGLLALRAAYDGDVPVVEWPDGRRLRGDEPGIDEALSAHVGRPVRLGREAEVSHFDDGPVHLVTAATTARLAAAHGRPVDVRRLRANLVLETASDVDERTWVGRELVVGGAVLAVRAAMPRCVMVDQAQGDLPADGSVLHTVTRISDGEAGVWAEVVGPGRVRTGDAVLLRRPEPLSTR